VSTQEKVEVGAFLRRCINLHRLESPSEIVASTFSILGDDCGAELSHMVLDDEICRLIDAEGALLMALRSRVYSRTSAADSDVALTTRPGVVVVEVDGISKPIGSLYLARFDASEDAIHRERASQLAVVFGSVIDALRLVAAEERARRASKFQQRVYETAIEAIDDLLFICDDRSKILFASRSLNSVGKDPGRLHGVGFSSVFAPMSWSKVRDWLQELFDVGSALPIAATMDAGTYRGARSISVEMKAVRIEVDGQQYAYVVARDLSEKLAIEASLARSEMLYRSVVELAGEGIWLVDGSGATIFANGQLKSLLRVSDEEFKALGVEDLVPEQLLAELYQRIGLGAEGACLRHEAELSLPDGGRVWVMIYSRVVPLGRDEPAALLMFADITTMKELERELDLKAHRDGLTGLANRSELERFVSQAQRDESGGALASIFVDLDGFKCVNDVHGHLVGDAVLIEIANRLSSLAGPGDLVARIGGDEFVIFVRVEGETSQVAAIAERARELCALPVVVGEVHVQVSGSVGLSLPEDSKSPTELLVEADRAMYQNKAARLAS
jgi:diguanylate cyclase (GGDEF)-like protein/PAS domain S-box-containing protein